MRGLICAVALSAGYAFAADSSVTLHKDVLPILHQRRQACHRPGSIAPMFFLSYPRARPWAQAGKAAVLPRKTPPWPADPHAGRFSNDPSLKPNELEIISKWADSGAPAGDEKDAPPPIQWPANGWTAQPGFRLPTAVGAVGMGFPSCAPGPSEATLLGGAELAWMSPHMHLRGKDMALRPVFPDGKEQALLDAPHYDFNWRLGYSLAEPIKVPKGSKLTGCGRHDNSANNRFNPDPSRRVRQGDMTREEMFAPFFAIVVDKSVNPAGALRIPFAAGGA